MKNSFKVSISILICMLFIFFIAKVGAFADTGTLQPTISLEKIDGINVPKQNNIIYPSFEYQTDEIRTKIDLGGEWKKERQALDHQLSLDDRNELNLSNIELEGEGRHLSNYDDTSWDLINLPAVENVMPGYETDTGPEQYEDGVWYRRNIQVDESLEGQMATIKFMSINYIADIWINDNYVGYHEGGYTPFAFDVSDYLVYGDENVIVIRVDNPPWGSRNDIVPAVKSTDWTNYTGVVQDLFIEFSNATYIPRVDVVPKDTNGNIDVT